jgi:hypothetical protein
MLKNLIALAQNAFARPVIQLLLPRGRRRKRDGFGECRVWTRMLALLLLLLKKCQWNFLLELTPMGCDPADAGPNGCDLDDADPNGCDPAIADPNGGIVRIVDEDEEEEEEVPLIRKNSQRYIVSGESSNIPSPALSALVGLKELSIANFDQALKDVVPEDLLSEPTNGGMMDVCSDIPDVGLELSRAASCASSTLECGLRSQEAGQGCSIPMEVTENPSALEVAAAKNPVPKDGASGYPTPRVLPVMIRLGWVARAPTQPPRVLPVVIRLRWTVRAATQPPRVSEWAPLLIPPSMSTSGLLLHILIVWQQHMLQMRKSP